MSKTPIISIVTVVYSGEKELELTILSVLSQTYPNIEYIIIDGGSTDGTLEIIKKYEDRIDHWMSEKDDGIYDAMNKGINFATGDFIEFLNAGDGLYADNSIEKIVKQLDKKDAIYFGRAYTYNDEVSWIYPSKNAKEIKKLLEKGSFPNHQAMFFPKAFYKNNFYDLYYKITSDIDYKLRAYCKHEYIFVDEVVVRFALGGISTQNENFQAIKLRIKENIHRDMKYKSYARIVKTPIKLIFKYLLAKILGGSFHKILKYIKRY